MADDTFLETVRAERLKERIYVSFTALAVLLALRGHHPEPGEALSTLIITTLGTLTAAFLADLLTHLSTHRRLFQPHEWKGALRSTSGGVAAIVLPVIFLGFAAAGAWRIEAAMTASLTAVIAWLVAIAYGAVRRTEIPVSLKVGCMLATAGLGLLVVTLEMMAH